jgi:hypothetical protein
VERRRDGGEDEGRRVAAGLYAELKGWRRQSMDGGSSQGRLRRKTAAACGSIPEGGDHGGVLVEAGAEVFIDPKKEADTSKTWMIELSY